jgi:hypothetical protein
MYKCGSGVLNASSVTFFLNIYTARTREEEKRIEEPDPSVLNLKINVRVNLLHVSGFPFLVSKRMGAWNW